MPSLQRLSRRFYQHDAMTVARRLLGQRLVRVIDGQILAGTIVETEAYLGVKDLAAHTAGGRRTQRNASMWGEGGHAYIYFTYGMHHCFNVVASVTDDPVAVLIRAIEPTHGVAQMQANRPTARKQMDLCSGPAKLCQALQLDRTLDGQDLVRSSCLMISRLRSRALPASQIVACPRIGVDYAGEWAKKPLRFYVKDNSYVSKPASR